MFSRLGCTADCCSFSRRWRGFTGSAMASSIQPMWMQKYHDLQSDGDSRMSCMKKKKICIFSICSCLSCPPVELKRGAHRKQHKGNHCVTNGNLCSRPCDDIIHKLVTWRTQEVRSYIVPHLKEKREHCIRKGGITTLTLSDPGTDIHHMLFFHP